MGEPVLRELIGNVSFDLFEAREGTIDISLWTSKDILVEPQGNGEVHDNESREPLPLYLRTTVLYAFLERAGVPNSFRCDSKPLVLVLNTNVGLLELNGST